MLIIEPPKPQGPWADGSDLALPPCQAPPILLSEEESTGGNRLTHFFVINLLR